MIRKNAAVLRAGEPIRGGTKTNYIEAKPYRRTDEYDADTDDDDHPDPSDFVRGGR